MIEIDSWIDLFLRKLDETFGNRVWLAGLRGSYAHGEATEDSNVDVVVLLDKKLTVADIKTYGAMLDELPYREKICGFFADKSDFIHWEISDLFQFYYDTKIYKGSFEDIKFMFDASFVKNAIKINACNIYRDCVHNMLHSKSIENLKNLYIKAAFLAQAAHFWKTGKYISRYDELQAVAYPSERMIIENYLRLKNGKSANFDTMSEDLFRWTKTLIEVDMY